MAPLVRRCEAWRRQCDPRAAFRYSIDVDQCSELRPGRRLAAGIPHFRSAEVGQVEGAVEPHTEKRRIVLFRLPGRESRESLASGIPCMVAVTSASVRDRSSASERRTALASAIFANPTFPFAALS